MSADNTSIDNFFVNNKKQKQSSAEHISTEHILQPVSFNHMLKIEGLETDLPESPKEEFECPAVPDMKKAEEDYNSIDYQMIAFNLWKSKAREL